MFLSPSWKLAGAQRGKAGRLLLLVSTLFFVLAAAAAGYGKTCCDRNAVLPFPDHLGKVVYQEHADRNDRIYIIAQSHRSAITGKGNEDCRRVQAEIYRIGEWLITHENVAALLPEGYFSESSAAGRNRSYEKTRQAARLDDATLAARLADPAISVNADRLLYSNYDLALRQVEDRNLYFAVVSKLRALLSDTPTSIALPRRTVRFALSAAKTKRGHS